MGNAQSDERSEPKLSYNDVLGWHVWKQADHAGKDNIVWEIISVRLPSPGTGQSMPRQVYIRNRDGGKYLAEHFDCTTKLVDGCSSQDCVWVLSYGDVEQTFIESNRGNYLSAHLTNRQIVTMLHMKKCEEFHLNGNTQEDKKRIQNFKWN